MTKARAAKTKTRQVKPDEEMLRLRGVLKQHGIDAKRLECFAEAEGKPVFRLFADGPAAIKLWEKLRRVVAETGYWPLIMGNEFGVWEPSDLATSDKIAASWAKALKRETGRSYDKKLGVTGMILQAGGELDAAAWLKKHRLPDPTAEEDMWAMLAETAGGKLSRSKPNTQFHGVYEVVSGKPLKHVTVALWPTREGWEVPALMRYGGWNACPMPHVQVALLRRWQEQYDAELVVLANDVLEMRVGRPPKTRAAAMTLAREQYSFCDDIVSQGTMSLERLADTLQHGTVWYFWWD